MPSQTPRVSVIMPAYNCERFIAAAVESVIAQTEPDWELIVVDDGSTDATAALARDFAARDPRVRVHTQPNSGRPACARNAGLRHARGAAVAFLDADDRYHPDKLAASLDFLAERPELTVVFHNLQYTDTEGRAQPGSFLSDARFHALAAPHLEALGGGRYLCRPDFYGFMSSTLSCVHTSAVLVRATALATEPLAFAEDLTVGEDTDLWFRLVRAGRAGFLDRVLSYYRHNPASLTQHAETYLRGLIAAHTRNFARGRTDLDAAQRRRYRRRIGEQHASLAYQLLLADRAAEARRACAGAIRWDGPRRGYLIRLLKASLPGPVRRYARRRAGVRA